MNTDVEFHIRQNYPWGKLPANVKQSLGNSQREYEKAVILFSIKNQLRFKGHLVKNVYKKEERLYYEEVLKYSREHLMLFPYHLSDVLVKGLRVTPFSYYTSIMQDIMSQEKSYDALPNFTAADCLRLMGIGRNQYIDLMNQCRSSKKFFRKKPVKDLLPIQPIEGVSVDPWWKVHVGYITEDDVKNCNTYEKAAVDQIIDKKVSTHCGEVRDETLLSLYRKGLVYLEVPVDDDDCIIVPPLEGFVMNRVLGDYFETLLYKIFVSIDEHTTVAELASVLEIDLDLVKSAVSMYCRLGFAKKKNIDNSIELHPTWKNHNSSANNNKKPTPDQLLIDWTAVINEDNDENTSPETSSMEGDRAIEPTYLMNAGHSKRIAFMFDSTLTAFLMMGNLSPGLKSHAVTMFEVGKLSDESLDSFLGELEKVNMDGEGEAQRYFDHAVTLRDTIRFLRYNRELCTEEGPENNGLGIDLLRCESLLGLDPATCSRVLNKNYSLLISMAPLSNEIRPISSCTPQHIGPAVPEVNSVWFKLFIYNITGCGPPTLLLVKGTKLRRLPKVLQHYDRLLVTTWGHDPGVIPTSNILLTLNDALSHSAVLVQAHGWHQQEGEIHYVPFPFSTEDKDEGRNFQDHQALRKLGAVLDLEHSCGFVSLLKTGKHYNLDNSTTHSTTQQQSDSCDKFIDQRNNNSMQDDDNSSSNVHSGNSSSEAKPSIPSNGIKDPVSAEMLESELDLLDDSNTKKNGSQGNSVTSKQQCEASSQEQQQHTGKVPDRTKLKLEFKSNDAKNESSDSSLESDWLLLDCYYGIPLFDANVNKLVCDKILQKGLCKKDCLQDLLHSSQTLSLRLLSFIAENQDLPVIQEHSHESGMIPCAGLNVQQTVPYPTHNIIFADGHLSPWDGY